MTTEAQQLQQLTSRKGTLNEDNVFDILFDQDEISWQTIIHELIKTESMDPWNIDVSIIAEKFIKLLADMKKMDFRISGKVILAAAFFLKIKSDKLLKEDIAFLDSLIKPIDDPEDFLDMLENSPMQLNLRGSSKPVLTYRTPQPRKRKVSIYDLVDALEQALAVDQRRSINRLSNVKVKMKKPTKSKDMTLIIDDLFKKIKITLKNVKVVWFKELIPSESKEDKINTFVPLIFLDNQRKIRIDQKIHFGDIKICLHQLADDYSVAD